MIRLFTALLTALVLFSAPAKALQTGSNQWATYNFYCHSMPISELPWQTVTHILHVFVGINPDGSVAPDMMCDTSTDRDALISAAHAHGVKVLLVVAGIDTGSTPGGSWTNLYNNASANAWVTAGKISAYANQYGYDGVAMDPEPWVPMPTVMPVFTNLMRALRLQLDPPKLLTSAATATRETAQAWGHSEALSYLDRLHVMSFNLAGNTPGGTSPTSYRASFNAALWGRSPADGANGEASVSDNVEMFMSYGTPPDKLNVVLPFYGVKFASNPYPFSLTVPIPGQGTGDQGDIPYNAIAALGLPEIYDAIAQVPWAQGNGAWYSYDNPQSIRAKVDYVIARGLGGIDAHEIGGQYFPSATQKHPLWQSVTDAFAAPHLERPVSIDIDEACLTRLVGTTQSFSGSISGASVPATIDIYVFNVAEQALSYKLGNSTMGGRFATGALPNVGTGSYWLEIFAPGNQSIGKYPFKVLATP